MQPQRSPLNHPKIKPILVQRFTSGKNKNEKNLRKRSMTSTKVLKLPANSSLPKHITNKLTSQHQPSKLEYESSDHQFLRKRLPTTIIYFFSNIKSLQSLTTFNLQVHQPLLSKKHFHFKPLLMSIASLKNLSNLSILFSSTISQDPELLKIIFKYLKRIKTLKDLTFSFGDSRDISTSTSQIDILLSNLIKLRQLHSLNLPFCSSFRLSEYLINKLTLTLPKLRFLTNIDVRFNESFGVADFTENLFSCFSKMNALSDITLVLQRAWTDYVNDPISAGLSLLDPSRIQKLSLQPYHHFDSNCLVQFSKVLKNFTSLHTFQIVLTSHWLLQEEGPTALFSTLGSLVSLSSLAIILRLKYEDSNIVEKISVVLKELKNLVHFKLQFEGSAFLHEKGIQQLFSNLRLLKSVRFLTLNCPFPEIDDQHLEILGESLKELPQLQNLSLDFSFAKLITNHGIEALAGGIKTLNNLSGLTLWLQRNENLDNMTIDQITEILQNLPDLYSVDFCLMGCPRITCFDGLLRELKQAKNIGEVALTFPDGTMQIEDSNHLMETKIFKRLKKLE